MGVRHRYDDGDDTCVMIVAQTWSKWDTIGDPPLERSFHGAAVLNDKVRDDGDVDHAVTCRCSFTVDSVTSLGHLSMTYGIWI